MLLSEKSSEAKVKKYRLVILPKEVAKKPGINFVLQFTLVRTIWQSMASLKRKIYKMYASKSKRASESGMELNPLSRDFGTVAHPDKLIVYSFVVEQEIIMSC